MMAAARPWKIQPATVAGVLAIVLIGIGWGLLLQRSAKLDAARSLEPELSEEAFEDDLAGKARPPASVLALSVSAFVLVSLFCLTYEVLRDALRRALTAGVDKLPWLRVSQPDAATVEAVRRSKWPRAIGKLLLIAALSLLWASQDARRRAEKLEAARSVAVDQEAVSQDETESPPAAPQNDFVTGIFSSALCLGLYEFAGVFAAAVVAWAAGAALPLGTHLWLSNIGWLILLGGSFLILMIVGQFGQMVLGEAPGWLAFLLMAVGIIAAVSGVERFIRAIPIPCPECGRKAFQTSGKPIIYTCRQCQHVLKR